MSFMSVFSWGTGPLNSRELPRLGSEMEGTRPIVALVDFVVLVAVLCIICVFRAYSYICTSVLTSVALMF